MPILFSFNDIRIETSTGIKKNYKLTIFSSLSCRILTVSLLDVVFCLGKNPQTKQNVLLNRTVKSFFYLVSGCSIYNLLLR